jgi:hypothetical protein
MPAHPSPAPPDPPRARRQVPHRVSNTGATDRVHVVVDIAESPRQRVTLSPGSVCHYDVNKGLFCGLPGADGAAAAAPQPPQGAPVPVPAHGTVPAAVAAPRHAPPAAAAQRPAVAEDDPRLALQQQQATAPAPLQGAAAGASAAGTGARLEALQRLQLDSQRLLLQQERLLAQQQAQLLSSLQFAQGQLVQGPAVLGAAAVAAGAEAAELGAAAAELGAGLQAGAEAAAQPGVPAALLRRAAALSGGLGGSAVVLTA